MHIHRRFRLLPACLLLVLLAPSPRAAEPTVPVLFVHHSVGRYLLEQGDVRAELDLRGREAGVVVRLWDHDYNAIGLIDPDGQPTGRNYGIPEDNTDPDGWAAVWTRASACRDSLLSRYRIVAFKSCFTAAAIGSDAELAADKDDYRAMAQEFDQHPDRTFVVITPPPRHRLATDADDAARARALADWLGSADFLAGHPNVVVFDLFDRLAAPDDGSPGANMLRYAFERDHDDGDSHPNTLANQTVGPEFAGFLVDLAAGLVAPAATTTWSSVKTRYR